MIDLWMPGTQARCAFVGMTGRWLPSIRSFHSLIGMTEKKAPHRDDKKGGGALKAWQRETKKGDCKSPFFITTVLYILRLDHLTV